MSLIFHITCPEYNFENLDLEKVSQSIDNTLTNNFHGKDVVIRGVQSEKHSISKEELVNRIQQMGTDRYDISSENEVKVNDRPIDFFGYRCKIEGKNICLPVLEGFHKWKPMSLEIPQRRADIWMVYDTNKLENVEYNHHHYKVKAKDGYLFKDKNDKSDALLGIIVIN